MTGVREFGEIHVVEGSPVVRAIGVESDIRRRRAIERGEGMATEHRHDGGDVNGLDTNEMCLDFHSDSEEVMGALWNESESDSRALCASSLVPAQAGRLLGCCGGPLRTRLAWRQKYSKRKLLRKSMYQIKGLTL